MRARARVPRPPGIIAKAVSNANGSPALPACPTPLCVPPRTVRVRPHRRTFGPAAGEAVTPSLIHPVPSAAKGGGWVAVVCVRACLRASARARARVCVCVCVCARAGFVSGGGSRLRLRLGVRGRAAAVPTEWGTRDRLLFCLRRKVQPLPPAEPRTLVRTGARCDARRCAFTCAVCALRADFYILQAAFYMLHVACCLRLHG